MLEVISGIAKGANDTVTLFLRNQCEKSLVLEKDLENMLLAI